MMRSMTKSNLGKKGFIQFIVYCPPLREFKARHLQIAMKAETTKELCSLICFLWLAQLSYTTQNHQSSCGSTQRGMGSHPAVINEENVLTNMLTSQFGRRNLLGDGNLNWDSFFPYGSSLCCIDENWPCWTISTNGFLGKDRHCVQFCTINDATRHQWVVPNSWSYKGPWLNSVCHKMKQNSVECRKATCVARRGPTCSFQLPG